MRSEQKIISSKRDYTLTITRFPVLKAQRILLQIAQAIGGSGAQLISAVATGQKGAELFPRVIALLQQVSPVEFEDMLGLLLSRCTVSFLDESKERKLDLSSAQAVDLAFGDDVKALYLSIGAVMEVNFSNFLEEIALILQSIQGGE